MSHRQKPPQSQRALALGKTVTVIQQLMGENASPEAVLKPPFAPHGQDKGPTSPLSSLRVSETRIPLVGRTDVMKEVDEWLQPYQPPDGGPDHRVTVIHGPGGAGKTRLAAEILQKADSNGWLAGFLPAERAQEPDWSALSHPFQPIAMAVDYAEARHSDLQRLFEEAPVGHEGSNPIRLVLIVREHTAPAESWYARIAGAWDLGRRANMLLSPDRLKVFSLEESLPKTDDRRQLWTAAAKTLPTPTDPPEYLGNELFERPLYVLLDAHRRCANPTNNTSETATEGLPTAESLIEEVLRHERQYWTRARSEIKLDLTETSMNQIAIIATLTSGGNREAFEDVLAALPWLEQDRELRRQVVEWWSIIYATGSGAIRGIEPDIVGEHLVIRALGEPRNPRDLVGGLMQIEQLTALVGAASLTGRSVILQVLTRIANGEAGAARDAGRAALAEILSRHLNDFLPKSFVEQTSENELEGRGETIATTIASAIIAADALQLIESAPDEQIGNPSGDINASVRNTALGIVRRQIDRIAEREFEAGLWPGERYAEIAGWTLRFDLETRPDQSEAERRAAKQRAARLLTRVRALQPPPHQSLAAIDVQLARSAISEGRLGDAERLYQRTLNELKAAGEEDSPSAYAAWHALAEVFSSQGDHTQAVEGFEKALAGKRRLNGLGDPDTIATLSRLARQLGARDIDAGLARLTEVENELAGEASSHEVVDQVRKQRPLVFLVAGRRAASGERYEEAKAHLEKALAEAEASGESDSVVVSVILHDLGGVAAGEEDGKLAIEYYERALAGKTRHLGAEDHDTIATLVKLARQQATENVDLGLERLVQAEEDLAEGDPSVLEFLSRQRTTLLTEHGRFLEATEVTRRRQEASVPSQVPRAIFEAIADPTALSECPSVQAGIEMALLATDIFSVGDPRLTALASGLAELYVTETGLLVASQMAPSARDDLAAQAGFRAFRELRSRLGEEVPDYPALASEVRSRLSEALVQLDDEPVVSSINEPRSGRSTNLADDRAIRRWLARAAIDSSSKDDSYWGSIAMLFSLYIGLRLKLFDAPPLESRLLIDVWKSDEAMEIAADEHSQLAADLEEVGFSDLVSSGSPDIKYALEHAIAHALEQAGRAAKAAEQFDVAEDLLEKALADLEMRGASDSASAYMLWGSLADVAAERGKVELAIEHYERALEGRARLRGKDHPATLSSLLSLARQLALKDLDLGLARLAQAEAELNDNDRSKAVEAIRQHRVMILLTAGRQAASERRYADAEGLFHRTISELISLDEESSIGSSVVWGELGDAAANSGKFELAIERYEHSLAGKTRLLGAGQASTVATLMKVSQAIAVSDVEGALLRLERAAMDLATVDGEQNKDVIHAIGAHRAKVLHVAAVGARKEKNHEKAEALFTRALAELDKVGLGESSSAHALLGDLGDLAFAQGKPAKAIEHYERAVVGMLQTTSFDDSEAVSTLLGLTSQIGSLDLQRGLERLTEVEEQIDANGDEADERATVGKYRPAVIHVAGLRAESEKRFGDAKALYEQALDELATHEADDVEIAFRLWHDLGDVTSALGEDELALEHYERAFAGRSRLLGMSDDSTLASFSALAQKLGAMDLERGLERLQEVEEQLSRENDPRAMESLHGNRALMLHSAARKREHNLEPKEAGRLYTQALETLEAIDKNDVPFAYVIWHDLGDVARALGEEELALEHYEHAHAGKARLLGVGDPSTVTTIKRLADCLFAQDPLAAAQRINRAVEELQAADASGQQIERLRDWLDLRIANLNDLDQLSEEAPEEDEKEDPGSAVL